MSKLALAAGAAVLLALVTGCGSSSTSSSGGSTSNATSSKTVAIPSDVCSLFPVAEVGTALSATLTLGHGTSDHCFLNTSGGHIDVPSLGIDTVVKGSGMTAAAYAAAIKDGSACGGAANVVAGIGDTGGCIPAQYPEEIQWVAGGHDFAVLVDPTDPSAKDHLIALAKIVQSHLPTS